MQSLTLDKKLLILFIFFVGIYFGKDFIMPIAIGVVLSALFLPFCKWLQKKGVPRVLAPLLCVLALLLFVAGIILLVGWQVSALVTDAAVLKEKVTAILSQLQQYIYDRGGISKEQQIKILKEQQSSVSEMITSVTSSFAYILTCFILVLVYIYLLLYYRAHIKNFIIKLSPVNKKAEVQQVVYQAVNVSQQYLLGLSKMIGCLWIMYAIGFSIVGVKNAVFFAILCGLLEIIPFIGNITGTTITILVSQVQGGSSGMLIGIVITYLVVQFIQGWILESIIVGPQVKVNPLFTILALALGELLWGIPGLILAIPLLAMFKIVCDHIESLKPYGYLFGEVEHTKRETTFSKKIKNGYRTLLKTIMPN
jgi:predicted PurR-regulated permease PerM